MEAFTFKDPTAWCPGCGNFDIRETLRKTLDEMGLDPSAVLLVGGIGQAAKTNQYLHTNGFSGLHGRALPPAAAASMVNQNLTVIVNTGDGDSYGEGGNHFLHNIRRNVNITHMVHDNQVYGLTKGQVSPTSSACEEQPGAACNLSTPLNPLVVALAAGASFVARSFSGNKEHLSRMMRAAIDHKGYALLDILQPCVSFNKVNTFAWYNDRVYELEPEYSPTDRLEAMRRAGEFGDKIPIGILYQNHTPTYTDHHPSLYGNVPLVDTRPGKHQLAELLHSFT